MEAEKASHTVARMAGSADGVAVGVLRLDQTRASWAVADPATPRPADHQDHQVPPRLRPGVRIAADLGRSARGRRAGVAQNGRETDAQQRNRRDQPPRLDPDHHDARSGCGDDPRPGRPAVRPRPTEPDVDLRHHLPPHRAGLALPVRGPRRLLPPRPRLVGPRSSPGRPGRPGAHHGRRAPRHAPRPSHLPRRPAPSTPPSRSPNSAPVSAYSNRSVGPGCAGTTPPPNHSGPP